MDDFVDLVDFVDFVCVCCQERLLTAAFETQCCLLPICDDCWVTSGTQSDQTFTCPNCSILTNPVQTRVAVIAWFHDQISQTQANQQKLLKNYSEQLQLNQQYHRDHLNAAANISNSLVTAFSAPRSDLAEVKAQLNQISQASTKSLTLTRNDYLIVQKQLLRLGQILQYLARVTESTVLTNFTLDHLDQLLLIQRRLNQTPIPTQTKPLNLTLVSHRYGVSVYLDDFRTKLNHCRAVELKLPLQSPLRTITWPNAATWLDLIGVRHPSKYFGKDTIDFEAAEWPQAGYFSYIFECKTIRTYLAVTVSPVSRVETVGYPQKPKGYHEIALTPFWLVWLDTKTNQVFYHRGLTGLSNQPGDCRIKPVKVIDLAICQDPKSTTAPYDSYLVNDDYLYINTVTGLWRKYLPNNSPPVWFSPISNVRQFYYGWYVSLNYHRGGHVSTVGQIGWDGRVLHQEVVEEIESVRIFNANIQSIRHYVCEDIYFFNCVNSGVDKFVWPGKMSQVGFFKITTQGDIMVMDQNNNIVFY